MGINMEEMISKPKFKPRALKNLRDTVIKFDDPTEPVGLEDWDALK